MAGTIAGLGYSQRFGSDGRPLAACKLYIYAGGTSTPSSVYSDYALGQAHTWPIVADAAGIIPMFWMADGTYRVRLTDAAGNEVFDDDGVVAIGPSSGTGGGGSSVEAAALFTTGDFLWQPVTGTRTGWVRANARTIGSAASGGTERANADVEDLFLHLWNTYSDSLCPITGGRGISAAADWSANKVIATLDMRGRMAAGLDDMGNSAASVVAGETSAAQANGAETVTVAQANLPNVSFTVSGTAATHTHTYSGTTSGQSQSHTHSIDNGGGDTSVGSGGGTSVANNNSGNTGSASADHTHTYSGTSAASGALTLTATAASGGSGTALDNMPPCRHGTWYLKL